MVLVATSRTVPDPPPRPRSPTAWARQRRCDRRRRPPGAGFCYGLALADDRPHRHLEHVLVIIGVEKLTGLRLLDDRGAAFIFADGAGAVVVGPSDHPGIGPVV